MLRLSLPFTYCCLRAYILKGVYPGKEIDAKLHKGLPAPLPFCAVQNAEEEENVPASEGGYSAATYPRASAQWSGQMVA